MIKQYGLYNDQLKVGKDDGYQYSRNKMLVLLLDFKPGFHKSHISNVILVIIVSQILCQ